MSLIIAKDKVGEFTENLSSFMKERNVNLQYEEVVWFWPFLQFQSKEDSSDIHWLPKNFQDYYFLQ